MTLVKHKDNLQLKVAFWISLVAHLGAVGALAKWTFSVDPPKTLLLGDAEGILLYVIDTEQSTNQFESLPQSQQPIYITPTRAVIASRTYVAESLPDVTIDEMLQQETTDLEQNHIFDMPLMERIDTVQPILEDFTATDSRTVQRSLPPSTPPVSITIARRVTSTKVIPPDFSGNRPATFPLTALQRGLTGTVRIRIHVAVDGRVTIDDIIESSGHAVLDAAAVSALRSWRATPARRDGVAIESSWILPFVFSRR